jgi:hypothetical protein
MLGDFNPISSCVEYTHQAGRFCQFDPFFPPGSNQCIFQLFRHFSGAEDEVVVCLIAITYQGYSLLVNLGGYSGPGWIRTSDQAVYYIPIRLHFRDAGPINAPPTRSGCLPACRRSVQVIRYQPHRHKVQPALPSNYTWGKCRAPPLAYLSPRDTRRGERCP